MKQVWICIGISAGVFFGSFGTVLAAESITFSDVPQTHWAAGAIEKMRKDEILNGYSDGTFRPDQTVTCAEFIKMAVSALGERKEASFLDGHWGKPWYEQGKQLGWYIKEDIGEGELDFELNRGRMALIAAGFFKTAAERSGAEQTEKDWLKLYSEAEAAIADVDAQTEYEYEIVCTYVNGILKGYPDGTFRPDLFLTRAEAAVVVQRLTEVRDLFGTGGFGNRIPDFSALSGDLILDLKAAWSSEVWESRTEDEEEERYVAFRAGDSYRMNPAGLPKGALCITYCYPYEYNDWFFVHYGRGILKRPEPEKERARIAAVLKRMVPAYAEVILNELDRLAALNNQKDEEEFGNLKFDGWQMSAALGGGRISLCLWPELSL